MYRLKKIGALTPKSASQLKSSRLGIGFEKLDRDSFDPEKAYDKLAAIGVKWIRIQSGWAKTEKQKGVYDFAWLDSIVDNLIARGMIPWMCMCYGNSLYTEAAKAVYGAVGCPPIHTEQEKTAWHDYCVATAKHFRGRVTHFEIWNEPDGKWCWKHGANATELGRFTIDSANAIREGNPNAYIIGGSLCQAAGSMLLYVKEAFETGMADAIDGFTFHEYVYSETQVFQKVRVLRGLFNLYGKQLDMIQGESGSQSRPFGHGALRLGGWTPRKQAKQLLRHAVADLLNDVKFTSFFSCLDMKEALNGTVGDLASCKDYGYFGVLGAEFDENGFATGEYTPKPSYYALQNLASLLGGDVTTADLPVAFPSRADLIAPHTGDLPITKFEECISGGFRLDNGSYAFAYWKPCQLMTTEFEGATTLYHAFPCDEIHLVDPMDGAIYEIPQGIMTVDELGRRTLKEIPIKDYPMFLVFGKIE